MIENVNFVFACLIIYNYFYINFIKNELVLVKIHIVNNEKKYLYTTKNCLY